MIVRHFVQCLCAALICFVSASVQAKEVSLQYKGLTLNANLQLAADKVPIEDVILITHGGLAHRGMEFIVYIQSLLTEYGYNTLAINLSLGLNDRQSMYDCQVPHRHRNRDAADEIGVWVDWLSKQGAKRVTLLGHSRGGAQTALFASERDSPLIRAVVLMAPVTRENGGAGYQKRYGKPLATALDKARKLIAEGKGGTVLENVNLMFCRDTSATAKSFVSYYGPDQRLDTPYLIPKLKKPTLVVVAGGDSVVVGLGNKVSPLVDGKRVQMKVVDAADHLFRDLYADDAVEAIDEFLKRAGN